MEQPREAHDYKSLLETVPLSTDEGLIRRLEKKLQEYKERARRNYREGIQQGGNIAYTAPEHVIDTDTQAKIKVLEILLAEKKIQLHDLKNRFPELPFKDLENAFYVIKSYAEKDEKGIRGGTGLPKE